MKARPPLAVVECHSRGTPARASREATYPFGQTFWQNASLDYSFIRLNWQALRPLFSGRLGPSNFVRALLFFLLSLAGARSSEAQQTRWQNVSLGDWFVSGNWDMGVPNSGLQASIPNGGSALINAPGATTPVLFVVADSTGATSSLFVSGAGGGALTVTDQILIGKTKPGTSIFEIYNGGKVSESAPTANFLVGVDTGVTGNVNIHDAGSMLTVPTSIVLGTGSGGTGTLTLQNGGVAQSATGQLAFTTSSHGTATVTGAGSTWTTGALNVGNVAVGALTISNGGTVVAIRSTIATMPGSNGTATITGNGSLLSQEGGDIYVGGSGDTSASGGTGAFHVLSGGQAKSSLLKVFSGATAEINNGSTTVPGMLISGDAPSHVSGGSLGDLTVGSTGLGRMEIRAGGTATSLRGYIGFGSGSEGYVLVTGSSSSQDSLWQCTGSVWVGNGGNGTLEIRDGGFVSSDNNGYIAFGNNTTGYAIVSGSSAIWSMAQSLFVGGNGGGPGGIGTLQIENGGAVSANTTTIYNTGGLALGGVANLSGATTFLGGSATMLSNTSFTSSFTLGTGGIHIYTNYFDATFSGIISGAGALDKAGGFTVGPGTLTLTNPNTYGGGTTITAGRLLANNISGSATGTGAVTVSNGAILGGTGTITGPVTVNSTSSLLGGGGGASGALKIGNNLTLNTGAKIQLVLDSGGAHSTLTRTGGTWTFAANQAFTFIDAGAQPGFYDNIITGLTSAPAGVGSWTITNAGFTGTFSYDGSGNIDLNLTAVPTPPSIVGCGWSSATVYPVNVLGHGVATAGNFLYSFGGHIGTTTIANSYKFDGATWTPIAPLPTALYAAGVVSNGSSVYIFSGLNVFGTAQTALYRYNPASNTYTTLAPALSATYYSAATILNGRIYKIGGFDSNDHETNKVEVYDIAANSWSAATNYPVSAGVLSAFAQNGFVYGAGGANSLLVGLAKTYRYDPGTNSWSDGAIADLPVTRFGAAAMRYNNSLVLAGGYLGGGNPSANISNSVISWDATTNTWLNLPDMLQPRALMAGAVLNGSLFVIAGRPPVINFIGSNDNQKLNCPPPTFTVTTVDDHNDGVCNGADCTLREAITSANARTSDDLVLINFAPGVTGSIQLTAALPSLSTNITVQGPGANLLTVRRNTGGNYRIFTINSGAVVNLNDVTVANGNLVSQSGGGINNAGTLTIANAAVSGNACNPGNGGGIFNTGIVTITNSTISGNSISSTTGAGSGGGIFNSGGTLTVSNSTISGNTAIGPTGNNDSGGGIITNVGIVTLTNTTISGNSADFGGGVWNLNGGTVHSGNTIIALNTAPTGPNLDGVFVSDGHNLIGTASGGSGFTNGVNGDQVGVASPNLGSLGDNGGPTSTVPLLANSPAINAGDDALAPSRDQRSYTRTGVSDIGAYEFQATLIPLAAVSRKTHGSAGTFDINLPLSGNVGVECRSGGPTNDYRIVLTFGDAVTFTGASVTSGIGSVSSSSGSGTTTVIADLTGVANAQKITLTLTNVNNGLSTMAVNVPMGVLLGDTSGNGIVNATDVSQTKSRSGQAIDASNFRSDVNLNNSINGTDVSTIKSKVGTALPSLELHQIAAGEIWSSSERLR